MIRIVAKDLKLHVTQGIKMVPRKSKGRGEESLFRVTIPFKRKLLYWLKLRTPIMIGLDH